MARIYRDSGRKNHKPEEGEEQPMSNKKSRGWAGTGMLVSGALCLILACGLSGTPVFAQSSYLGDEPLLDKLRDKGVLTQEEYDELMKAETPGDKVLKFLSGISIGTLSYFDFSAGEDSGGENFNEFSITRGYIIIRKQLTPWLAFRITPDITLEKQEKIEIDGEQIILVDENHTDFKLRLKYLYAEFRPPDFSFLTSMRSEVGMGHMPWLDFEEHINPYRCQGTMFIERAGTFNSADLGVSIRGYLGRQLDEHYLSTVSKYYAGRWGSWHIGVYNGSGYHASENNTNKVPEYRLSVRPLPDIVPGLQVHYFGLYGEGNHDTVGEYPDYRVHLGMLSYQNEWVTFTGQYAQTWGNASGTWVVPGTDQALKTEGYSFFVNTKLPVLNRKLNLFARYDHFDPDRTDAVTPGDDCYDLVNSGLAWEFYHHWMALLVYETVMYEKNNGGRGKIPSEGKNLDDAWRAQTVLQMQF
jgi:hypothetical protein